MKKNTEKTNAIRCLEQKKINFQIHDYTDFGVVSGKEVAEVLNEDPEIVFKTLVTRGKSEKNYVFLVPVNSELDLKKAATAVNEKYIEMIRSADLLPLTGYVHGGCSPIGMKKFFRTIIDSSAQNNAKILFNGGKIGIQIETTLEEIGKVIPFELYDIVTK